MQANFFLKKLIIQNFATFKNQTIHFRQGFNAIVGETGSGKSLVLDALQLILGSRADKKVVRKDTDYSLIEASFYCEDQNVRQFLESEGYPLDGNELIIKRLIFKNGATKSYINQLSTTIQFLANFSRKYIDLVGQFENQKLLSSSYQLQLLDHFGKLNQSVLNFQESLSEYKSLNLNLKELEESKNFREQRLDYLNYQLQEIDKLNPSSQDEEELLKKKNILLNVEKIQKLSHQFKDIFEGGEATPGLLSQVKSLLHLIHKNRELFEDNLLASSEIEDKIFELSRQLEKKFQLDIDQQELEIVLDKLDLYQRVKKKFGGSVESILSTQVDFYKEKETLENLDFNLEETKSKITKLKGSLDKAAHALHQKRLSSSKNLSLELTKKIQHLKMKGAEINLVVEELEDFNEMGKSKISFLAETNPGEGFFHVKDVASGGELSRILLGLRQILSSYDSISIFLFDEIDTGIGGETAVCIGKALEEVGRNGQVIAITHLPQIAQFAENLVLVKKEVQDSDKIFRTESSVREIHGAKVKSEIKAMLQLIQ
jgi:DNA repair protein RecN (Recombination protein N)